MPTLPKALEHMSKNLTAEERQLREQAEEGVIPDRGRESHMEKPAIMTKNAAAGRYWRKVLERMKGLAILDDLDSDALGVYCVMLARYHGPGAGTSGCGCSGGERGALRGPGLHHRSRPWKPAGKAGEAGADLSWGPDGKICAV